MIGQCLSNKNENVMRDSKLIVLMLHACAARFDAFACVCHINGTLGGTWDLAVGMWGGGLILLEFLASWRPS